MNTLTVAKGHQAALRGLGIIRGLRNLSEKTVTKAVRDHLRKHDVSLKVEVSCTATPNASEWSGLCGIQGQRLDWRISNWPTITTLAERPL